MEEKSRTKWLMSLPLCATVNEAMQELTGRVLATSDQHKDTTPARITRDCNDMTNILNFVSEYNPFSESDSLRNIVSGLTSSSSNVHKVREMGDAILENLYGSNVFEFSFSRKAQVLQIGHEKQLKIDGEPHNIDPQLLFHRLLAAGQASDDENALENLLKYELSTNPPALFNDNGLMREAVKSQLADMIASMCPTLDDSDILIDFNIFDGGSLLHRINWTKNSMYSDICNTYVNSLKKIDNPIVIFDGYNGPSIKDTTRIRRSKVNGPKIIVSDSRILKTTKEKFLSNESNKCEFITLLMHHLQYHGIKCNQAPSDADVLIARKGVEVSTVGPTCVIAEDTDVLVLLIHHAFCLTVPARCLYFRSDRHNSKHGVWDIGAVCEALGEELCRTLPFVHAIAGCDSTSRLFGIGKGLPLKKMKQPSFRTHAEVFCGDEVPSKTSIIQAGEKSLVCMYGGTDQDDLDRLRVRKFKEKAVTSASSVKMQSLPPTRDAAKYHSLRVLYQVRVWKGMDVGRDPLEWGWFEKKTISYGLVRRTHLLHQNAY